MYITVDKFDPFLSFFKNIRITFECNVDITWKIRLIISGLDTLPIYDNNPLLLQSKWHSFLIQLDVYTMNQCQVLIVLNRKRLLQSPEGFGLIEHTILELCMDGSNKDVSFRSNFIKHGWINLTPLKHLRWVIVGMINNWLHCLN